MAKLSKLWFYDVIVQMHNICYAINVCVEIDKNLKNVTALRNLVTIAD